MPVTRNKKLRLFLLLVCICGIGAFAAYIYMPSFKKETFREAMGLKDDRSYFIFADTLIADVNAPILNSGVLYIPVDFIKAHLDKYIFWDEESDRLSITTENKVIRMSTDSLNYYVNDQPMRLNLPVYKIDGHTYLPAELAEELYNVDIVYNPDSGLAVVSLLDEPTLTAEVSSKTANARFEPDIKSPVIKKLSKSETVVLLEAYDKNAKFTKIRADNGVIAYVPTSSLGNLTEIPAAPKPPETPLRPKKPLEGKITLLWDQVFRVEDNSRPEKREPYPGLDVISPTWFSFDEETLNGDIINIADKSYVEWAHSNGYQVWALITDTNRDVNRAILSNTASRENAIKQLLALTAMYELDGINVDFEYLRESDAQYYIQFLRELGPLLRKQGASLSVDMYVPMYTKYYNRTEVGKVADYICVMTYDEHYSGSENSGPVASLPFVDRGISDTMQEVPKEKVIMGLPFYVRVWREVVKDGNPSHTIKNYAMSTAYNIFVENGASFTWLPDIGSYYAEYDAVEEGEHVTYRVWLEDQRSIDEKLKLATELDVAGVACWKRGLETEDAWEVVAAWREGV